MAPDLTEACFAPSATFPWQSRYGEHERLVSGSQAVAPPLSGLAALGRAARCTPNPRYHAAACLNVSVGLKATGPNVEDVGGNPTHANDTRRLAVLHAFDPEGEDIRPFRVSHRSVVEQIRLKAHCHDS